MNRKPYTPSLLCHLFLALVVICFTNTSSLSAKPASKHDTLIFIHVTDPHVCNLTGLHPFFIEKRQHFGNNISTFPDFLKSVPGKHQADFVVVTGDNIDFYEAETEKGGVLDTQIEQYSGLLDQCNIPVYLTLGNHDIASYSVNPGLAVTASQINAGRARAAWMRNVTCFAKGTYYSRIFKIDTMTFRFIFLDNSYSATSEISDGVLPFIVDQYQLRWLDEQMKASVSDVEIIFMHIPLPYGKAVNNKILTEPISLYSLRRKSYNLITLLEKNSSASVLITGHKHINLINRYSYPNGGKLTQILTSAFGYDTANWRVIKVTKDNIMIGSPGNSDIEYNIPVR
jgi:3',5'-cyclic AMP phosphodiesterase CpdA